MSSLRDISVPNGRAVDSIAVAADDMILTALARLDLLDSSSLAWLRARFEQHALDALDSDMGTARAEVFCALAVECAVLLAEEEPEPGA